jgi:retron-type reverse transcriptase
MDIQGCFDNIDHGQLIGILEKDISDKPFFDLM